MPQAALIETYKDLLEVAQHSLLRLVAGKDGSLYFEGEEDPATIHFRALSQEFVAMPAQHGQEWVITVAGNLGPVPYSAECAEGRAHVFKIINESEAFLAPHASLYISPTQQVIYSGVTQHQGELTTNILLEIISFHALCAQPCNDLLRRYRGI